MESAILTASELLIEQNTYVELEVRREELSPTAVQRQEERRETVGASRSWLV
jgi:hypothetical protein